MAFQPQNKAESILYLVLFIGIFGLVIWLYDSTPDCIRTVDGVVRCECDFPSSSAFQTFKEETHGTWEAVIVEDACK